MVELIISVNEANQRCDKYVRKFLNNAPLDFVYRLFRKKDVKVNNIRVAPDYILKENDVLKIYVNDEQLKDFHIKKEVENLFFDEGIILYEDENILIVNKEKGVLVHGDLKEKKFTLRNQVLSYLQSKGEYHPQTSVGFTPAPSHRLDRNTSGIIVFAKNLISQQNIEKMLHDRTSLSRKYLCLVSGVLKDDLVINTPLKKDEAKNIVYPTSFEEGGQEAITKIKIRQKFNKYTLLEAELISGRTHQIRAHLKSINHPIIGDPKYGNFSVNNHFKAVYSYDTPFLHAFSLTFYKAEGHLSYLSGRTFECPLNILEKELLDFLRNSGE